MTRHAIPYQSRPDRRFRKMLPAVVAAAALLSATPGLRPASAQAGTPPRPPHAAPLPDRVAVVKAEMARRSDRAAPPATAT